MASMEEDIQKNLHPISSHQETIRPLAGAYYEAKNELDRMHEEQELKGGMGTPMSMDDKYWQKRERLCKIVNQYENNYNYRLRGNSTIEQENIAAPSRDDTDL